MDNVTTPTDVVTPIDVTPISVTDSAVVEVEAGMPDGQELSGTDGKELIVYEYDDSHSYIGFHKESI